MSAGIFASKRDDPWQTLEVVYDSTAQRRMLHYMMILCRRLLEPTVSSGSPEDLRAPKERGSPDDELFGRRVGLGESCRQVGPGYPVSSTFNN